VHVRYAAVVPASILVACSGDGTLNLFTIQDDIDLGREVRDEILADSVAYPVVHEDEAPEAYDHLYRIRDAVLDSGEVEYADEFDWEVYLIDDPHTLNAFAAPGGYMFFYTGLVDYLDMEDHFAGVMGHELAHADRRHSTQQLTKAYGVATLLEMVLGRKPGLAAEIAASLVSLKFSRNDETDADDVSVAYLCETVYAADGTAGFFAMLEEDGGVSLPEFLSTHPSGETRVEDIRQLAEDLGCSTEPNPDAQWSEFQGSLR
jgi:predicted Zn-dependent protease